MRATPYLPYQGKRVRGTASAPSWAPSQRDQPRSPPHPPSVLRDCSFSRSDGDNRGLWSEHWWVACPSKVEPLPRWPGEPGRFPAARGSGGSEKPICKAAWLRREFLGQLWKGSFGEFGLPLQGHGVHADLAQLIRPGSSKAATQPAATELGARG